MQNYNILIVGAGHAGVEAALAGARLGKKVALFTIHLDNIAMMSCNPAIGGPGKSHLVSEIGMLGAQMAQHIDKYNLQLKNLNHTKGLAAKITRAQADKYWYRIKMREIIEKQENLDVIQTMIEELVVKDNKVVGAIDNLGLEYKAKAVILCTGTFLNGQYIIGDVKYSAGRQGEKASNKLAENLANLGIEIDRYQTATPPRIDKKSINFEGLEKLHGEENPRFFSYLTKKEKQDPLETWLTFTTPETIKVGQELLQYSPIVTGVVSTKGPRHCPSLDRKIMNFPDKTDHQIFLEQESKESDEIYVNGFTTAMPPFAQEKLIRTIKGLENAKILRYGYAIEYDFIPAKQLKFSLESKIIENLFQAGTINGTSGYEEAAAQGFIAGVNAVRKINNEEPIIITRDEGYIGVLIDDIINKQTPEPYRVLPSRAEYRLTLRQDNTFIRLIEKSKQIGLLDKEKLKELENTIVLINDEIERLKEIKIYPSKENNLKLSEINKDSSMNNVMNAFEFLGRQEIDYNNISNFIETKNLPDLAIEQIEIEAKYRVFIERERKQIEKFKKLENIEIPEDFNFENVKGLSNIAISSLSYAKVQNIGQATRISGVTYNDIAILLSTLKEK